MRAGNPDQDFGRMGRPPASVWVLRHEQNAGYAASIAGFLTSSRASAHRIGAGFLTADRSRTPTTTASR